MSRTLKYFPSAKVGPWRVWLQLELQPQDVWIGVYWQDYPGKVYVWVCLVPCLPIHMEIWKRGTAGF